MSFDFKAIPESKIDVQFEFKGQKIDVVVNANAFTQEVINSTSFAFGLSKVIESWSAEEEPTLEFLNKLPVEFIGGLYVKCQSAVLPKVMTAGQ